MMRGAPDPTAHQAMRDAREFDLIRALVDRWGDLAVGIGDDAAQLPPPPPGTTRVITTDATVEGVHFLESWLERDWLTPHEMGARAAAATLSDLAAMGADAEFLLVAFTVPAPWRVRIPDVADGIGDALRAAGARVIGGNVSRGATFSITLTALGAAARPVARVGARPGDLLVVTGRLGGPAHALEHWGQGRVAPADARARFAGPVPRLRAGRALAEAGAAAMIDISDGLLGDAEHLAAASDVRVTIDAGRIPCMPGVSPEQAITSGEEYELLAALPAHAASSTVATFEAVHGVSLTVIGTVDRADDGTRVRVVGDDPRRTRVEFTPGHDHLSG